MEKTYAKALNALIAGGLSEGDAYTKLLAHLKRTGRMKVLPQLLRELKTEQERAKGREPLLEVATDAETRTAKATVHKEGISPEVAVNPSLISGWRLTTKDTLYDRSGKRALIDLYRRVTH